MGKINVLSFEIANLIAAGEVVERPASVLKELIENSIDSGASKIVAEIKHGGVSLIRVTDNGCGIDKEDLPVALKRHATSKIKDKDDLSAIMTLGFRGEALAAISSVSKVTIITKTADAESGYMLTSNAGIVDDISEVCASDGTTVVVNDLFYNVPARRKFLKKDSTEAMNVAALVERVALSRPDISIQLLIDGEERFNTPGDGDLSSAIYSVFGKDFSKKLIKVDAAAEGVRVHGYIGRSDNVRKNRNLMNVFVNGRYVKSLTAQAAIERAYTSYIAPEAFPTCVLFIEMNPKTVDVNVHPAKLEVKFADERVVFEIVYYTVKSALEEHEYRPDLTLKGQGTKPNYLGAYVAIGEDTRGKQMSIPQEPASPVRGSRSAFSDTSSSHRSLSDRDDRAVSLRSSASDRFSPSSRPAASQLTPKDSNELLERYRRAEPSSEVEGERSDILREKTRDKTEEATAACASPSVEYTYVGEAFNCYVLVEYEGDLLVIDKHAAHERVIFEDLKKQSNDDGRIATQMLMLPITVIPTPEEYSCAVDHMEDMNAVGFEYTVNDRSIDIIGIPGAISSSDAETLFSRMLTDLYETSLDPKITDAVRREKSLYQIACKAAIKGGRVYDRALIDWLVKKLLSNPDIVVCPHGRPVAFRLTKNELDRHFDRLK